MVRTGIPRCRGRDRSSRRAMCSCVGSWGRARRRVRRACAAERVTLAAPTGREGMDEEGPGAVGGNLEPELRQVPVDDGQARLRLVFLEGAAQGPLAQGGMDDRGRATEAPLSAHFRCTPTAIGWNPSPLASTAPRCPQMREHLCPRRTTLFSTVYMDGHHGAAFCRAVTCHAVLPEAAVPVRSPILARLWAVHVSRDHPAMAEFGAVVVRRQRVCPSKPRGT